MTALHKNQEVIYKPDYKVVRVVRIDPVEHIVTCIEPDTRKVYVCEEKELEPC